MENTAKRAGSARDIERETRVYRLILRQPTVRASGKSGGLVMRPKETVLHERRPSCAPSISG